MNRIFGLVESLERLVADHSDELSESHLHEINSTVQEAISVLGRPRERVAPPRGAELLWLLAGEKERPFQAYLRQFPNQELQALGRNRGAFDDVVRQFQSRITTPHGDVADGVPRADLQSSNIYGFQYDPNSQMLRVRFQNGGMYEYDGVPPFVYKMFERGSIPAKTDGQNQYGVWWQGKQPSLGASFYELIRDQFPYQRVA